MTVTFPVCSVGVPLRYKNLSLFPLFAPVPLSVPYDLADEAIGRGTVTVEEVSESGSVPDLSVENLGDVRVLFLEGEELVGAKQNRILNTSLLIAAHTKSKLPVSCVEQGALGLQDPPVRVERVHVFVHVASSAEVVGQHECPLEPRPPIGPDADLARSGSTTGFARSVIGHQRHVRHIRITPSTTK